MKPDKVFILLDLEITPLEYDISSDLVISRHSPLYTNQYPKYKFYTLL